MKNTFGLATTPISFIMTPQVLSVRKERIFPIEMNFIRSTQEQNKSRKFPITPLDLSLRLLNSMVDGYLDLRAVDPTGGVLAAGIVARPSPVYQMESAITGKHVISTGGKSL